MPPACARDLRRDVPYLVYPELDFDVITFTESDALARFYVRLAEMRESANILRQALDKLPEGPYNAFETKKVLPRKERTYTRMEELIHDFMLINMGINPPIGEVYQAIESSKGRAGILYRLGRHGASVADEDPLPLDLQPLGASRFMLKGGMISDIVAVIGSLDPVMGEADK